MKCWQTHSMVPPSRSPDARIRVPQSREQRVTNSHLIDDRFAIHITGTWMQASRLQR
jgi:hypothetical protein